MQITAKHLRYIAGSPAPLATKCAPVISQYAPMFGVTTLDRMSEFLGQLSVESRFTYVKEIWGPTKAQLGYEGRDDLGNTEPGDGKRFMGHGMIQITGRENHREFTNWLRKYIPDCPDFEANPDSLAEFPWAVLGAFWYWTSRKLNVLADKRQTKAITKKVNGGYNHLNERIAAVGRAREILKDVFSNKPIDIDVKVPIAPLLVDTSNLEPLKPYIGSTSVAVPSKATTQTVQRLLFSKGYKLVGKDDGRWGKNTRDGVMAFRRDHGLPIIPYTDNPPNYGGIEMMDPEFMAAIVASDGRPVDAERAGASSKDIAKIVPEVQQTRLAKYASAAATVAAGVPATVASIANGIPDAKAKVQPIIDAVSFDMPTWGWLIVLTAFSGATWFLTQRAEKAGVGAYRDGERLAQS